MLIAYQRSITMIGYAVQARGDPEQAFMARRAKELVRERAEDTRNVAVTMQKTACGTEG